MKPDMLGTSADVFMWLTPAELRGATTYIVDTGLVTAITNFVDTNTIGDDIPLRIWTTARTRVRVMTAVMRWHIATCEQEDERHEMGTLSAKIKKLATPVRPPAFVALVG
jgi:hypothetical protein